MHNIRLVLKEFEGNITWRDIEINRKYRKELVSHNFVIEKSLNQAVLINK